MESLRSLGFSQSTGVEINTHFDAAIGGTRECLNDGPIRKDIGGKIDFMLCAVDKLNVNVFEVFRWRIVDGRGRIGVAHCTNSDEDGDRYGGAN